MHEMTKTVMVAAASQNSSAFIAHHPRPACTNEGRGCRSKRVVRMVSFVP
jgi:hypothetical protein